MVLIAQELLDKITPYFPARHVPKAKSIVENSQISISFQKGNSERFFTISGLILLNPKHQTRMSFKKEPHKLTSDCNCNAWNTEDHCPHVTALFISFLLSEQLGSEGKQTQHLSLINQGVYPEEFGKLLWGANRLPGSNQNSTYSSLQYSLTNKKVINFPLPKDLNFKVAIILHKANLFPEYELLFNADKKIAARFALIDQDGKVNHNISIFEYLYIFDWNSGEAYHQPALLKTFIRALKGKELNYSFNDYIRLTNKLRKENIVEIYDGDTPIQSYEPVDLKLRFRIDKSNRKNYLRFGIETYDTNDRKVTPPEFFSLLVYENGVLSSFRTKNDAEDFISSLLDSIDTRVGHYKKFTYGSDKRKYVSSWIDFILEEDEIELFDPDAKTRLILKSDLARKVIKSIFLYFGTNTFRFSRIDHTENLIVYDILKSNLFEGISNFYHAVKEYDLEIYYNDLQVKNWSSAIQFERTQSNLDWFELSMSVTEEDLAIIKKAEISDNFLISKNRLIILDQEQKKVLKFMKKYTKFEAVENEEVEGKRRFKLNFKRARIFELFELRKLGIDGALTNEELELCDKLLSFKSIPHYPLPENFKAIARDYQVDGYEWLRFLFENKFGACLADDMGLGKTLQTIMFLQSILHQVDKVIIICPVSILINWENEIKKFSDMDVNIYYGDNRKLDDKKIIITSYGVMKKESSSEFKDINFDIVIFDEVQQLKNIKSLGANAARSLSAKFRICLTGTPVENDLSEFYNIMDLAVPGVWGELGFIRSTSSKKTRLIARQTVKPFILRRTKDQVLKELPDKVEQYIHIPFSKDEQAAYIGKLVKIKQDMQEVLPNRKYGEVLKNLLELRQLCLWQKAGQKLHSSKIEFLMENLPQIFEENHKAIVFSQFTTYLDLIQNEVQAKGWKFSRIDGSQNMKKRHQQVQEFQEGDSKVFLISLKAGGFGLNLTAASYIFLMDPWWNPAVENQAIDRAHRIGQENKLTVYRPIIKDSVEEKVLILQNNKKELFKDLMAEDDDKFFNGKLSMIDFKNLLE